jgi:hypothetical protein
MRASFANLRLGVCVLINDWVRRVIEAGCVSEQKDALEILFRKWSYSPAKGGHISRPAARQSAEPTFDGHSKDFATHRLIKRNRGPVVVNPPKPLPAF